MNKITVDEHKICSLYLAGNSFSDIKRILGVNQSPATRILKANNIQIG